MVEIIDGKKLAQEIRNDLKIKCDELKEKGINPKLAVVMVGDNKASQVYVRNKSKVCNEVGIEFEEHLLDSAIEQKDLIDLIEKLNSNQILLCKSCCNDSHCVNFFCVTSTR